MSHHEIEALIAGIGFWGFLLRGPGDLVSTLYKESYTYPNWSYPNYNPTYNRLTKSLGLQV